MTYSTHTTGGILSGLIAIPIVTPKIMEYKKTYYGNSSVFSHKILDGLIHKIYPNLNFDDIGFLLAIFFAFAIIGSLFPDIDLPKSKISQKATFISKMLNKSFGHRGLIHSPFFYILLLIIINLLAKKYLFITHIYIFVASIGFFIGVLSHLLLDTLNKTGIPWLLPITPKKISILNIKTGGVGEAVFQTLQIVVILLYICIQNNLIILSL